MKIEKLKEIEEIYKKVIQRKVDFNILVDKIQKYRDKFPYNWKAEIEEATTNSAYSIALNMK